MPGKEEKQEYEAKQPMYFKQAEEPKHISEDITITDAKDDLILTPLPRDSKVKVVS